MHKVTVNTLTFHFPGLVVGESVSHESTMPIDPAKVEWPENAYAFSIGERIDVHDGSEVFKGEHRQIGPVYYHPDSVVQTVEDVEAGRGLARNKKTDILLINMRGNGWDRVVWSRWGNWPQPYDPDKHQILMRRE